MTLLECLTKMQNNKKTILITGGGGFVGINLALKLSKTNDNKIIIIDNFSSGKSNFRFESHNIYVICGDIQNLKVLDIAFKFKPKIVYHLAALFANQNSVDHPVDDLESNGEGTVKLLEYCVKFKVEKVLYTSSSCVYGNSNNMIEDSHGELDTPYAITKLLGEQYLKYFSNYYGLKGIIIRVFNCYGNYDYPGIYRNVIPNFFQACYANTNINIYGDGEATRSYMHIDDLIFGLIKLSDVKFNSNCITLNLGSDLPITIIDLANKIKFISNSESKIVFCDERKWDHIKHRRPNLQKARKLINWAPKISFKCGLDKYNDWFKNNVSSK